MISTALATSLIAGGVASADTAVVGGYIETTIGSGETPATGTKTNQGTTIGFETGVTFSGSKVHVTGSTSQKTGFSLAWIIAKAVAT